MDTANARFAKMNKRFWLLLAGILLGRLALHLYIRGQCHGFNFLLSPTEIMRTKYALSWAQDPSVSPGNAVWWLPLQFYMEGGLLRLWPDVLAVPFWFNSAFSLITLFLLFLLTRELSGSPEAGLAAALYAAWDSTGVLFGIGGTADPLMHAAMLGVLYSWLRQIRRPQSSLWPAAILLAIGNSTRFEVWFLSGAFTLYILLRQKPKAWGPLALVWAFPVFWTFMSLRLAGNPLAFQNATAASSAYAHPTPLAFLKNLANHIPSWIFILALAAGSRAQRLSLEAWYLLAVGAIFLPLLLISGQDMVYVDHHLWVFNLLLLPLAAGALISLSAGLGPRRRILAWLILAAALIFVQWGRLQQLTRRFLASPRSEIAADFRQVRLWRQQQAISPQDCFLIVLPSGTRRAIAFYLLWE
ncbi:MAG: glycosyltransferase family 39 protein, partial [Elusimicrobiota bacterium]